MKGKHYFNKIMLAAIMAGMVSIVVAQDASAVTLSELKAQKEDAQKEKQATENKLDAVQGDIDAISEEMEQAEAELEQLDELFVDLLLEVDLMKADITDKNAAIEQAQQDYELAIEKEEAQKSAMNKRIKYMYEKGNESYIEILLESKSMAEAVNRVDYTEKLYNYDRILLEKYQLAKQEVSDAKTQLETELSELEEMEKDLEEQEVSLNNLIEEKRNTVANFDSQLANAKARASEYEKQIKAQSDNLKKIYDQEQKKVAEEAKKKAEEEAKRKAEAAIKKKAEEDLKKKQQVADGNGTSSNTSDGEVTLTEVGGITVTEVTGDTDKNSISDLTVAEGDTISEDSTSDANTQTANADATASTEVAGTTSGTSVTASGSGLGTDIANYALQFVGNPYVPGGTSLTNGADCSGFTQSVYAHFGISIPRSSSEQAAGGVEVAYENIQPGDILYYGGHVAIYIGNNQIVHASTPSTGIKVSNALYRSVITVRRYY